MNNTGISWTDCTWNPVTGCSKVSAGCKNCYAERLFARAYPGRDFIDVRCHEDRLAQPLAIARPSKIFVNSMSDLFHEAIPGAFLDQVFAVMASTPRHTYQVLTKRPARMQDYIGVLYAGRRMCEIAGAAGQNRIVAMENMAKGFPNLWLGVSVEDQATADERIPVLLDTEARVRFVSAEPLLGPVNLRDYLRPCELSAYDSRPPLDWVIVGGESGPGARVCDLAWIRDSIFPGMPQDKKYSKFGIRA